MIRSQPEAKDRAARRLCPAKLPAEIEVYAGHDARLVPAGLAGLQRRAGREGLGRLLVLFKAALV